MISTGEGRTARSSRRIDHLSLKTGLEANQNEERKSCEYRSPKGSHGAGPNFVHSGGIVA